MNLILFSSGKSDVLPGIRLGRLYCEKAATLCFELGFISRAAAEWPSVHTGVLSASGSGGQVGGTGMPASDASVGHRSTSSKLNRTQGDFSAESNSTQGNVTGQDNGGH